MAIKHVREYYERMTSDYMEMRRVLEEMENMSEENAGKAFNNLDSMRKQVKILEANYKRLSYIMFLLNQPTKESKKDRYFRSEKKKLDEIPNEDRMEAIVAENLSVINNLKSYI